MARAPVLKEPSNSLALNNLNFNDLMTVEDGDTDLPPPTTATTTELGYINQVEELVIRAGPSASTAGQGREEPPLFCVEEKGSGEKLYKVYDDTKLLYGQACGPNRPFKLRLMDNQDRELIQLDRPYVSCDYCCGLTSCFDIVNVWVRNFKSKQLEWRRFGQIRQFWCPLLPYFSVRNAIGQPELTIRGPLLTSSCLSPVVFPIKRASAHVGSITKAKGSLCIGNSTDNSSASGPEVYSLKFPPGIDEKLKVTLIGALLLINYKFYDACNSCPCLPCRCR